MRLSATLLAVGESGGTAKLLTAALGPIAQEQLSADDDGLVVLELKRGFSDGARHLLVPAHDFIARLAALVPCPIDRMR